MKVIREFRIGNRRYTKGETYAGADAKKYLDAGLLGEIVEQPQSTSKTKKGEK